MSKNVETLKAAHQAFNKRDFDGVVKMMTENFIYEDRARGARFAGRKGFKEFMQGWVDAFSNAEVSGAKYVDGGDTVVALFSGCGTNDGPLGSLPRTGKQISLPFCEVMRFNGKGQIVSGEAYYDQQTMLAQLGHATAATV